MSSTSIDASRAGSPHLSPPPSSNTSSLTTKIKTVAKKFFLHLELYYLWIPKKLYDMSNKNAHIISQSAPYGEAGHDIEKLSLYKRTMYAIWIRLERLTEEPAYRYNMKYDELRSLSQSPSALSSFPSRARTNAGSSSFSLAESFAKAFSGAGSPPSSCHPQEHEASPSRAPATTTRTTTTTTTTVSSNGGGSTASSYFPAAPLYPEYEGQPEPGAQWSLPSSDDEELRVPDPRVAAPTLPRATYDDVDPNHPFPIDPE